MKNLLKNKLFLTLFASDLLSNFGDVLYYLALMSYVLQLPDARLAHCYCQSIREFADSDRICHGVCGGSYTR